MIQTVVSFGGGINSTAMLVGMQERGLIPDAILFADTGCEMPYTYQHVEAMQRWCVEVGFPAITVVSNASETHASLEAECHNNETLPSKAFGFSGCSVKWKRQPMDRWIRDNGGKEAWASGGKINRLIGIHAGEIRRGKIPDDDKYHYCYPLREWGWHQSDCIAACERTGFTVPKKSACFFCPAMKKNEILRLKREYPDLFERAIAIERQAIEAGSLQTTKGLGRAYRWESLAKADEDQLRLFTDWQSPQCESCFDGDEAGCVMEVPT